MDKQSDKRKVFDLAERTARFAEAVIAYAKLIHKTPITVPLITQLVKAGTSVGANYCEDDDAESRKDFIHKIGICRKEARETKYWIRMTVAAQADLKEPAKPLWLEAKELHLIFVSIVKKTRAGKNIEVPPVASQAESGPPQDPSITTN